MHDEAGQGLRKRQGQRPEEGKRTTRAAHDRGDVDERDLTFGAEDQALDSERVMLQR